jgi:hypothetical protein
MKPRAKLDAVARGFYFVRTSGVRGRSLKEIFTLKGNNIVQRRFDTG